MEIGLKQMEHKTEIQENYKRLRSRKYYSLLFKNKN